MERDTHSTSNGKYEIHSLYFDDYQDSCIVENDAGISARAKYRIRYYNTQPTMLQLERKEKLHGRCHKESCPLTLDQYQMIINGETCQLLWEVDHPLLQQFCTLCITQKLEPKAIIDYERTAYVEELSNVRITLDENISVSGAWPYFLDGDYLRYPIQERGQHVLEVKFDEILPSYIHHVVTDRALVQTSFSKYYLGRKRLTAVTR